MYYLSQSKNRIFKVNKIWFHSRLKQMKGFQSWQILHCVIENGEWRMCFVSMISPICYIETDLFFFSKNTVLFSGDQPLRLADKADVFTNDRPVSNHVTQIYQWETRKLWDYKRKLSLVDFVHAALLWLCLSFTHSVTQPWPITQQFSFAQKI